MKSTPILAILLAATIWIMAACETNDDQRVQTRQMEQIQRIDAASSGIDLDYRPGTEKPYADSAKGLEFDISGLRAYLQTSKYSAVHINYPDDMDNPQLHFSNFKPLLSSHVSGKITATFQGEPLK